MYVLGFQTRVPTLVRQALCQPSYLSRSFFLVVCFPESAALKSWQSFTCFCAFPTLQRHAHRLCLIPQPLFPYVLQSQLQFVVSSYLKASLDVPHLTMRSIFCVPYLSDLLPSLESVSLFYQHALCSCIGQPFWGSRCHLRPSQANQDGQSVPLLRDSK